MSSRQIRAALKRKGVTFERVEFEWSPTPGESVPTYTVILNSEAADYFGELAWNQFDDTDQALAWVDALEPYVDTEAAA